MWVMRMMNPTKVLMPMTTETTTMMMIVRDGKVSDAPSNALPMAKLEVGFGAPLDFCSIGLM